MVSRNQPGGTDVAQYYNLLAEMKGVSLSRLICMHHGYCTLFTANRDDVRDEGYFIVAARSHIFQVSLDGARSHVLVTNTTNSVAIDYDVRYAGVSPWK